LAYSVIKLTETGEFSADNYTDMKLVMWNCFGDGSVLFAKKHGSKYAVWDICIHILPINCNALCGHLF